MLTRKDYMDGNCSHQEYYAELAKENGVSYRNCSKLAEIKRALSNGDEHLNTIPLAWWDSMASRTTFYNQTFKRRGDYPTLAGFVCLHKAAAKVAAMEGVEQ